MVNRVKASIQYWNNIFKKRLEASAATKGHQVHFYNWCHIWKQDFWMVDFIEKRGLLADSPRVSIGLYSIFAPMWLRHFDQSDIRIFIERENLHKPEMRSWLHRFLDESYIDLSIGFDRLVHDQYIRFPFWLMWNLFPPTANYKEIKEQITKANSPANHSYRQRLFCTFISSHDDFGRKAIFEGISSIDTIHSAGKLFHNNDDLQRVYGDDKLKYLRNYRFNLTPENSDYENYVTEKLFEAIFSGCIPIYSGSNNCPEPDILNQNAIIFVRMGETNQAALELIRTLNSNEADYLDFANQPRFLPDAADIIWNYYELLENKLRQIINNV